jgi:hypothetical protein
MGRLVKVAHEMQKKFESKKTFFSVCIRRCQFGLELFDLIHRARLGGTV